jgi:ATP-binding cassette, subfamily C (CFTR/MRP), member 1
VLVVLICQIQVRKGETAIAAAVLSFVETFPFLLLSYFEHTRLWRSSILLNSYLFLALLFDVVRSRTILLIGKDSVFGRIFSTAVSLKAVILLFESQGRSKCGIPKDVTLSPEETSGPFSLSAFLWLNDLMFRGGRKVLRFNDLYI